MLNILLGSWRRTLNTWRACCIPAWQSLSRLFISLWRKKCLILFPSCCSIINVYNWWRVLLTSVSVEIYQIIICVLREPANMLQCHWWEDSSGGRFYMQIDNGIYHTMGLLHELHTFLLIPLHILQPHQRNNHHTENKLTWTVVIKERVVFEMACTNGVPKASWISLSSVMTGLKHSRIFSKRIFVIEVCRGILRNNRKKQWAVHTLYM